jgi:hypothetical protein
MMIEAHMPFLTPHHMITLLAAMLIFFRPRTKPPIHPIPADDSALLRRIQLFRNKWL